MLMFHAMHAVHAIWRMDARDHTLGCRRLSLLHKAAWLYLA